MPFPQSPPFPQPRHKNEGLKKLSVFVHTCSRLKDVNPAIPKSSLFIILFKSVKIKCLCACGACAPWPVRRRRAPPATGAERSENPTTRVGSWELIVLIMQLKSQIPITYLTGLNFWLSLLDSIPTCIDISGRCLLILTKGGLYLG